MDEKTVFHLMEKMTFGELLDEDFDPFEADLEKKSCRNWHYSRSLYLRVALVMTYSVHSDTEHEDFDDLDEARDVAWSMAEEFSSSYIVDNRTNDVIERY